MGGKPKAFYTDNEGSFSSKIANKYYEENNIRHLITSTHAGVVERLIRTLKENIYERQKKYQNPRYEYIVPAVLT